MQCNIRSRVNQDKQLVGANLDQGPLNHCRRGQEDNAAGSLLFFMLQLYLALCSIFSLRSGWI